MRAAVDPCVALISECNAGSVVSIEASIYTLYKNYLHNIYTVSTQACLGAYIVCNYGEQIPYQLSGTDM